MIDPAILAERDSYRARADHFEAELRRIATQAQDRKFLFSATLINDIALTLAVAPEDYPRIGPWRSEQPGMRDGRQVLVHGIKPTEGLNEAMTARWRSGSGWTEGWWAGATKLSAPLAFCAIPPFGGEAQ